MNEVEITSQEIKYAERIRDMVYNAQDILDIVKQMELLLIGNVTNQKRNELQKMCVSIKKSYIKIVCP